MTTTRFTLTKSGKLYVVTDTHSNPQEDAVVYCFKALYKAEAFLAMMVAEHCK
jgi:hypothetical protein